MKTKSPLPILVGVFTFAFVLFLIISEMKSIISIFNYPNSGAFIQLKIQLVMSFLLPIAFGIIAIVSKEFKILIFPVMVYLAFQDLSYTISLIANYSSYFSDMSVERLLEIVAILFLEAACVMSIVQTIAFKVFKADDNGAQRPQRRVQQFSYQEPTQQNTSSAADPEDELRKAEQQFANGEISVAELEDIRARVNSSK